MTITYRSTLSVNIVNSAQVTTWVMHQQKSMMAADLDSLDLAEMLQEERRQLDCRGHDCPLQGEQQACYQDQKPQWRIGGILHWKPDKFLWWFPWWRLWRLPWCEGCLAREGGCPAWPTSGTDTPLVPGCLFPSAAASPPWQSCASPAVGSCDSVLVSTTSQSQVEDRQAQADREALAMDISEDANATIEIVYERRK